MTEAQAQKEPNFEVPYFYTGGEYLYSYGELSKFFREIVENKRLFATKCPTCGKVWMPPRGHCPDCYQETEWVPLTGKGTVVSCTYCYFHGARGDLLSYLDIPYVYALIHLDGTDTYLPHGIRPPEVKMGVIKTGTRVKAVFRDERKGMIGDFYFVSEEDQ
jgi:uncharacterized OB-fold protein